MPHAGTVNRLTNILAQIFKNTQKHSNISLAKTFRENKMPADYGTLLINEGAIIRISGGARGVSTYIWNNKVKPDEQLSTRILLKYSAIRQSELKLRDNGSNSQSSKDLLIEIRDLLKVVIKNNELK